MSDQAASSLLPDQEEELELPENLVLSGTSPCTLGQLRRRRLSIMKAEIAKSSHSSDSDSSSDGWTVVVPGGISKVSGPLHVTLGEDGGDASCRKYALYLPGTEGCFDDDDKRRRGGACWDPCPVENDGGPESGELHYLFDELNALKCVIGQVELLILLGARSVEEVSTATIQGKLKNHISSIVGSQEKMAKLDAHITQGLELKVHRRVTPAHFERLHEVAKQTLIDVECMKGTAEKLSENLYRFDIEPSLTLLEEIHTELYNKMTANLEDYNSKLDATEEKFPCCSLFGMYPSPCSPSELAENLPTPYPPEILKKLKSYQISPALKERWADWLEKVDDDDSTFDEDKMEFPRMLQFRLDQLIHEFPNGIDIHSFWRKFEGSFGYTPNYRAFLLTSLHEIVEFNQDIIFLAREAMWKYVKLPLIFFPACGKHRDRASPIPILKECYHRVKALLGNRIYLPVQGDLISEAVDEFRLNWDMDIETFLQCSIDVMKNQEEDIILHYVKAVEDCPKRGVTFVKTYAYVCINAKRVFKIINWKHRVIKEPQPLPWKSNGETNLSLLDTETEETIGISCEIKPNDKIPCELLSNYGPDNFGIVLTDDETRERMNDFQKRFQEYVANNPLACQRLSVFRRGQFVLARELDTAARRGWCRGRVISKDGLNNYTIYCMDQGRVKVISSSDLRRMPKAVLALAPALAISCSLRAQWRASVAGPVMQEIVDGKELMCEFHSSVFKDTLMTKGWNVSLKYREMHGVGRWKSVRDEVKRRINSKDDKVGDDEGEESDDGMELLTYYMDGCEV